LGRGEFDDEDAEPPRERRSPDTVTAERASFIEKTGRGGSMGEVEEEEEEEGGPERYAAEATPSLLEL